MFKANIEFRAEEDVYSEGCIGVDGAYWTEEFTAETKEELREKIELATYSDWKHIEHDNINNYDFAEEYHAGYMANDENIGEATEEEIELWKQGKQRLWYVSCHILTSKVTETPVAV